MPTVLSVTMAVGARLLAGKEAIVSRLVAIEELAGADVLCADKTGTLTQNKLMLGDPFSVNNVPAEQVILNGALASRADNNDTIDLGVLGDVKLPTTVGVMLVALVASLTLVLAGPYAGGFREQAATLVSRIDFNQVVLHGMLAFLLFAGSIQVSLEELGREWLTVSLLAIFGMIVSTCIVGGVTWLVLGWLGLGIPFLHALLFGALISPTDPIAVLGIMKSVGASRQLEVQVAGESLFNDGLGVVVFLVLLQLSGLDGAAVSSATAPLSIGVGAVGRTASCRSRR
jgi:hypothetical protein